MSFIGNDCPATKSALALSGVSTVCLPFFVAANETGTGLKVVALFQVPKASAAIRATSASSKSPTTASSPADAP